MIPEEEGTIKAYYKKWNYETSNMVTYEPIPTQPCSLEELGLGTVSAPATTQAATPDVAPDATPDADGTSDADPDATPDADGTSDADPDATPDADGTSVTDPDAAQDTNPDADGASDADPDAAQDANPDADGARRLQTSEVKNFFEPRDASSRWSLETYQNRLNCLDVAYTSIAANSQQYKGQQLVFLVEACTGDFCSLDT